jgi:TfoX/Sxy family transcriptional regulator of competence genes
MAFNEQLADRIRELLVHFGENMEEKKMMGGLAFMFKGKMCCGVIKDSLMVRVIESKYEMSLENPHCRVMDFTGKALKGFLFVDEPGFKSTKELNEWVSLGIEFAHTALIKDKKKGK